MSRDAFRRMRWIALVGALDFCHNTFENSGSHKQNLLSLEIFRCEQQHQRDRTGFRIEPLAEMTRDNTGGGLFDRLFSAKPNSVRGLATEFVTGYGNDRDSALLEVNQFIVATTGSQFQITDAEYGQIGDGYGDIIKKTVDKYGDVVSSEYPLVRTNQNGKKVGIKIVQSRCFEACF